MRNGYFVLIGFMSVMVSSCGSSSALFVHTPEKVYAPSLTKGGELKLDLSGTLQPSEIGGSPVSLSADGAYAFTDHFAVIGSYRGIDNYSILYNKQAPDLLSTTPVKPEDIQHFVLYGYHVSGGIGVFSMVDENTGMEGYAGLGAGSISNVSPYDDPGKYTVQYSSVFLQFAMHYTTEHWCLSGGIRIMNVDNKTIDRPGVGSIPIPHTTSYSGNDLRTFNYITPYTQLSVGGKVLKAYAQMGMEMQFGHFWDNLSYRPRGGYLAAGVIFQPDWNWFHKSPAASQPHNDVKNAPNGVPQPALQN